MHMHERSLFVCESIASWWNGTTPLSSEYIIVNRERSETPYAGSILAKFRTKCINTRARCAVLPTGRRKTK